jgi:hypothetical protein
MIEIKQVISLDEEFYNYFFKFCAQSKPYDFCELNSIKLRRFKIKEYFDSLINTSLIFEAKKEGKLVGFVFLSQEPDCMVLEFAIGEFKLGGRVIMEAFREIISFAQKEFSKQYTKSTIQRKYKKQKFINFLLKYDKTCEIIEADGKTQIFWNK